ncbi:helix-turn-helix transcriptional regulator [Halocella sp. SP3-1]|uniref:helix-turn-helix domain-containing protein n=1 Tax=Halocella sp. SP3-1 TaxID=2382161 RepID=UPI000F74EAA7|nr:helix-turn-helix transcriptional regulator [Halocella sp. SP3-1]AZO96149.1 XRE family transcriptional regulator [Halocella sp. SP3-1]
MQKSTSRGGQMDYKNKDTLKELYVNKEMFMSDIGEMFGVSSGTIHYWLKKLDIPTRKRGGDQLHEDRPFANKKILKQLYLEKGMLQKEIAKKFNVSRKTIGNWLNKYNIPTRTGYGREPESNEWFLKQLDKLDDIQEYKFLETYKGGHAPIKCKHIKCGHIWKVRPSKFLDGTRCPECSVIKVHNKLRKTQQEFENEVKEKFPEYEVIGEYENYSSKVEFRHKKCGSIFQMTVSGFMKGQHQCRYCAKRLSSYEIKMKKLLEKANVDFIEQYTFDDCRYKEKLPFDFAIFNNEKLVSLLEIDGRQHFEPVLQFGGKEKFKDIRMKDKIKNNYCKRNGIKLVRIDARKWEPYKVIV